MGLCRAAFSLALAAMASATAAAGGEVRGVLELFTSQGCSSCPPADQLAGRLAADPSLVVMSLPIDYWDYLGWKDTLAKPRHAARQRAYAAARGDREVYTPQIVVNGVMHVLGSDKAAIEKALAEGAVRTLSLAVTMALTGDRLQVNVPAGKDEHMKGEVWVYTIAKHVSVAIRRGENGGQTITYNNVARHWIRLGEWNGAARTFTVPAAEINIDGVDTVAVTVQAGTAEKPGRMLGAATLALR